MIAKKYEWINLDQAEEIVKDFYTRGYLYKMICAGKLERRGPPKRAMIRKDQLLKVCKIEGLIDA